MTKVLNIKLSDLREEYALVKSEFPTSASYQEMHQGIWIAATRMASLGCSKHMESFKSGNPDYENLLNRLYSQIFFNADDISSAKSDVAALVKAVSYTHLTLPTIYSV